MKPSRRQGNPHDFDFEFVFEFVFVFFFFSLFSCSQSTDPVFTVEVISQGTIQPEEKVYITGNQDALGMWNPAGVQLQQQDSIWFATFSFPAGTQLEYKFTKGSWDKEALNADRRVPTNHTLTLTGDTTIRYIIPYWRDAQLNTAPEISGDFEIHDNFPVQGLDPRRVIVWLPPSYDHDSMRTYPVLYMHDGQNVFDPYTSTLGYDWRVDEIADSLIRNGEIEEFICVAVYCDTDVRGAEYSDDPNHGEKYQDFMCCQLKPWIDSVYRTKTEAEHTAVIGASMGGLISFILSWEYPDVFSMAGCMSPAFKVKTGNIGVDYVEDVLATTAQRNIELYIDNGTRDLEAQLQPGIDEMLKALDQKGYDYVWYLDQGAPHNEIAWSARVWRPLVQFFGK